MTQHQPKMLELIQQVDGGTVKEGVLDVKVTGDRVRSGCARTASTLKASRLRRQGRQRTRSWRPSASVAKEGIARLFEEWDK